MADTSGRRGGRRRKALETFETLANASRFTNVYARLLAFTGFYWHAIRVAVVSERPTGAGLLGSHFSRLHQVESSTPNSGVLSGLPSLAE